MSPLYPVFLKLESRHVLVAGAGRVAERRIERLVACGAAVRVVSPHATAAIVALASASKLVWEQRGFQPSDVDGAALVFATTGDAALNARIGEEALRRGVLLNSADREAAGDFHVPAQVEHAGVQLAISTGGASPRLSARLRVELAAWLGSLNLTDAGSLSTVRAKVKTSLADDPGARREELLRLGDAALRGNGPVPRPSVADAPSGRGARPGVVYLVGAGPGDPELLTVRARGLLDSADVVFYDRLISSELLATLPAPCEQVYVGKEVGCAHRANVVDLLVAAAHAGRRVVRLKGGDPFLYGRGGEEVLGLWQAGAAWEVVPGVSALCSVPAAADIPVTFRGVASELVVRSGHRARDPLVPTAQDKGARRDTTFVYFMAVSRLAQVVDELLEEGASPALPAAIIEKGTLPGQRVVEGELGTIVSAARESAIESPALLVAGDVVKFRRPDEFVGLLEAAMASGDGGIWYDGSSPDDGDTSDDGGCVAAPGGVPRKRQGREA